MSISLNQTNAGDNGGSGGDSLALSFTTAVTTPDFVVVVLFDALSVDSYTITDDQGNTNYSQVYQQPVYLNGDGIHLLGTVTAWTINAPNNFTTITVTPSSLFIASMIIMDFTVGLFNGVVEVSTAFNSGNTSPWSGASLYYQQHRFVDRCRM